MAKILQNQESTYRSINVPEEANNWDVNGSYNLRDEVVENGYYWIWASDIETNSELSPSNYENDVAPIWVKDRPTNYNAALDDLTSSQTEADDTLIIELTSNFYSSIALLNLEAQEVILELIDIATSTVVWTNTYDLTNTEDIVDEQTYWENPFDFTTSIYEDNMFQTSGAYLKITINNIGNKAKLGRFVIGTSTFIGDSMFKATLDIESYSSFVTNQFGTTTLTKGNTVKYQKWQVDIPTEKIPWFERKRAEWDAVALLFIMDEDPNSKIENGLIYGYFEKAPITAANPTFSTIIFNIKGVL